MNLIKVGTKFFGESVDSSLLDRAKLAVKNLEEKTCLGSEWTGWWNYPKEKGYILVDEILDWKKNLKLDYDCVVVIGIGGSYLGTRTVYRALNNAYSSSDIRMVYLGNNMSETEMGQILEYIEAHSPVVNVISKSGTTTEPAVAFRIVRESLEKKYGLDGAKQRIIATTDPNKGALRELSLAKGYKMFEVPSDIGGRFSVLSAVGLVPLALGGYDIASLMKGAGSYFEDIKNGDTNALVYACSRYLAYSKLNKNIEILSYSDSKLNLLIEWWKQLFGESEGKSGKGLFPVGLCLTTDLHSLGQFVQDGTRCMMETFISFNDKPSIQIPQSSMSPDGLTYLEKTYVSTVNQAASDATLLAHSDGGVPCLSLNIDAPLSESSLGAIFIFFEVACAISASFLEVNPFDQPGVEAYKKNLFAILGKPGYEDQTASLKQRLNSK